MDTNFCHGNKNRSVDDLLDIEKLLLARCKLAADGLFLCKKRRRIEEKEEESLTEENNCKI